MTLAAQQKSLAPHLLSDVDPAEIAVEPFAHLVRTNALPTSLYHELAAGFPDLATILGSRSAGSNVAVRMTVKQVLNDSTLPAIWREFFSYHTSADYWRDVVRVFGAHFRREFPGLEQQVGRAYEDWRVMPRGYDGPAEVRLDCQFVMNTPVLKPSSVKTPHIDLCDKIFSALLYFRDPNDGSKGGDLDLYGWRRKPRFVKHRTLGGDVEHAKTVQYAPNTYVCFVNSERAVHGVSPRDVTPIPRRYINFIAELPIKAFSPKQVGRFQRLFHASEIAAMNGDDKY